MQTESLFEAGKPRSGETAQTQSDAPRVLSVGVFPKSASTSVVPQPEEKNGWFSWLKNLFGGRKRRPAVVEAVQTEWSLDRVTVVRNDLSDTDFEVVVAEPGEKVKGRSLVGRAWKRTEVTVANPEPVDTLK